MTPLAHHLLPLGRSRLALWAGCAAAPGPPAAGDADRHPPDQVEAVLAEVVARPTIGARRLVEYLAERGVRLSASGVRKLLRRHRLGRRAQRVAALAS